MRHACHSAEGTDILIGSENVLSLEDQLRLVEEVGHPKLRLYFDTRNPFHIKGYDVAPMLERVYPHVCEVHLKDGVDGGNSTLLGKGNSGFLRSMEVLIQHRYAGWVILENDYRQIAADNGISPEAGIKSDIEFVQSLMALGGNVPTVDNIDQWWRPEQEAESLQAFNSDHYQKQREEKIISKIMPYIGWTRFKSVSFPEEDYTQYLRARNLVQGASRRLLDILRSAFNYLDEDPRQEMGQLDLSAVIQSLAANKPATDVFVLDEFLKPSFAWSVIFDVSSSMQVKGEYGRALAIAIGEAAKELMTDPTSWTFFAFSDKFYILKDSNESYSKRVRARIGGLKFEGLTYIPDAVTMAGKMLAKRFEEQRCLIVISDGWPYGYPNMPIALKECVDDLIKKSVIVIGIGVETDRMGNFFHLNSSIYTQKDLINKFGSVYANASAKALET